MEYYYTYRITNTKINKHYYGTRTSKNKTPEEDIGIYYFSSSKDKDFIADQKENPQDYKYKIIKKFNTRKEALELEIKLHNKFNVGINESFYNKSKQTSVSFDTQGIKFKQKNPHKDMSSVQLKKYENNPDIKKKISSSVSNVWSSLSNDEKQKRIENANKNQKEYYKNRKPFIFKLKQKGKTIFEFRGQKGEFRNICKEMKLPYDKLKDGRKMYEDLNKGNMKKLINLGIYPKYKGVYLEIS